MTTIERRAVGALASIYALRMFGLFLLLPVLALYADGLAGHTPLLVGLAVGIYGLTQACLQIPFGALSDRFGRREVITAGLLIFVVGSVVAAVSDHIAGVIAGRALQGAGAISAVVLALTADLTRVEMRTRAMAIVGMTIGLSFALALVIGPLIASVAGVSALFWFTAVLAAAALVPLWWLVPEPVSTRGSAVALRWRDLGGLVAEPGLWRLDVGIFVLHLCLTALFVAVPLALVEWAGVPAARHWQVYLAVLALSLLGVVPLVLLSARRQWLRAIMLAALAILLGAHVLLALSATTAWLLLVALWVFFVGFNTLEALLPALVSKVAPPRVKGAAMGVYQTAQFSGVFLGGVLGGGLYGLGGAALVFAVSGLLVGGWLVVAWRAPQLPALNSRQCPVAVRDTVAARRLAARLETVPGVLEATVLPEEGMATVLVDAHRLDEDLLEEALAVR